MKSSHKKQKLTAAKIIKILEENKKRFQEYSVKKIGLFGSFARKQEHHKSDVDILVTFDQLTFDNYMDLKLFLEKILKRKVDLVIEESLKPALKYVKEETIYAR